MPDAYHVKGWEEFQHYKKRNPPWIRLYRTLLDNAEWATIPADAAKLLVELWLVAADKDGGLPASTALAWRLRRDPGDVEKWLKVLVDHDFIVPASTMLARCKQDATPETETEAEVQRQTQSARGASGRTNDLGTYLGEYAGCLAGVDPAHQRAVIALYGPGGTQEHAWHDIAPERRPPILHTAIVNWHASNPSRWYQPFFASVLNSAVERAIAADHARDKRDHEATTANELRDAAREHEAREIQRLQDEARGVSMRGGGPQRISIGVEPTKGVA
ncbi:MAG: hypothetical protein AMXMBFR53_30110 [Gemmatimonadota bacterium]